MKAWFQKHMPWLVAIAAGLGVLLMRILSHKPDHEPDELPADILDAQNRVVDERLEELEDKANEAKHNADEHHRDAEVAADKAADAAASPDLSGDELTDAVNRKFGKG